MRTKQTKDRALAYVISPGSKEALATINKMKEQIKELERRLEQPAKPQRGRPSLSGGGKTPPVLIRIEPDVLREVDHMARVRKLSRAAFIREALVSAIRPIEESR
jgi:Ribbon-helix-helix protein, copG family.